MNKTNALLLLLCTIAYNVVAADKFDHQFFSNEGEWDDLGVTSAIDSKRTPLQNAEDCAVPDDESVVSSQIGTKQKRIKSRHSTSKRPIKPVELRRASDPDAPTPPGESLAKVITDETKLTPIIDPKRPVMRKVYDYRNRVPDKFYQSKDLNPSKENSHIPRIVYQKDLSSLLFAAVEKQDLGAISTLLERGADINGMTADTGFTPLMAAVWFGHEQATNYLIVKGANIDKQGGGGKTALHIATGMDNYVMVNLLLKAGAQWDIKDAASKRAIDYTSPELKNKMLLNIAELAKDKSAALLDMVAADSVPAVKYLLDRNANIEIRSVNGDTPLIIATRNNSVQMVNFLLFNGAQPLVYNTRGECPVMLAKAQQQQVLLNIIETMIAKRELEENIKKQPKFFAQRGEAHGEGAIIENKLENEYTDVVSEKAMP